MSTPVKLGLVVPPDLHARLLASCEGIGVNAAYVRAFSALLDALDLGEVIAFPAVRGLKRRITVRLDPLLAARLRRRIAALNLKITDFACTALARFLPPSPGA